MTDVDWYSADAATFGDRLTAAREGAGMTQKELARRLGVKLSTLQKWEEDKSEPRANRLSMIAGLLNVSVMWLLNGNGMGLGDPADHDAGPATDLGQALTEMRALRLEIATRLDRLARLEKHLRKALEQAGDV